MKLRAFYFLFGVKIFLFPLWDSKTSLPDVLKATLVLLFYNKFTSANMCVHVFVCVCLHVYLWVCVCMWDREYVFEHQNVHAEFYSSFLFLVA